MLECCKLNYQFFFQLFQFCNFTNFLVKSKDFIVINVNISFLYIFNSKCNLFLQFFRYWKFIFYGLTQFCLKLISLYSFLCSKHEYVRTLRFALLKICIFPNFTATKIYSLKFNKFSQKKWKYCIILRCYKHEYILIARFWLLKVKVWKKN